MELSWTFGHSSQSYLISSFVRSRAYRVKCPFHKRYSGKLKDRQMDVMFRKLVGLSLLAMWLVLFGIAFSETSGSITNPPDKEESVEATLANLGATIKVARDALVLTSFTLSAQPIPFYRFADQRIVFDGIRTETNFSKEDIPIYKLDRSFLI